eukprot:TRINITY_DN15949_c0_g2_i2.p1 TRINITY_DN15949_c0_g2~~TRINITY_DN15949_c0_g2_i2.p1  ORF type:complete len:162 (+),score=38.61 TRINITY_DN15949_c0_g2_i2:645-1130(+)
MLWQRGLSLYYVDRFEDGAKQMNPNDTEESIWAMLCEAQMYGFEEARSKMLKVGVDSRPVMRTVYALFRGDNEETSRSTLEKLAKESSSSSDRFYSAMYLSLYAEAQKKPDLAKEWMALATATSYAKQSGDYMADLARIHEDLRGKPVAAGGAPQQSKAEL